ncbi:unnamed protein product, partial [Didymodactylos carnosus]
FVDQFVLLLISLIQQQQEDQIKLLKENNQIKHKLQSLEDVVLSETLDLSNLIRRFNTNYNNQIEIEDELDWYNHLTRFIVEGWL